MGNGQYGQTGGTVASGPSLNEEIAVGGRNKRRGHGRTRGHGKSQRKGRGRTQRRGRGRGRGQRGGGQQL